MMIDEAQDGMWLVCGNTVRIGRLYDQGSRLHAVCRCDVLNRVQPGCHRKERGYISLFGAGVDRPMGSELE